MGQVKFFVSHLLKWASGVIKIGLGIKIGVYGLTRRGN
jgi:hypothetical protein